MKLVVLGAPGAGKGTQAKILNSRFNIPHISTGDILREHVKNKTKLGLQIKEAMDEGYLVSDEIALNILFERLEEDDAKNGYILDGFPRTINQAVIADGILGQPTRVIAIIAPDGLIVNRMRGRRICGSCGRTYHVINNQPKIEGVCDYCGGLLTQRPDDMPKRVMERLKIYHENTQPIIDFYKEKGLLFEVDGSLDIADITGNIVNELERLYSDGHSNKIE